MPILEEGVAAAVKTNHESVIESIFRVCKITWSTLFFYRRLLRRSMKLKHQGAFEEGTLVGLTYDDGTHCIEYYCHIRNSW